MSISIMLVNHLPEGEVEIPEGYRRCEECGSVLLLLHFNKRSARKDGYNIRCRICSAYNQIIWRKSKGEAWVLSRMEYYRDNKALERTDVVAFRSRYKKLKRDAAKRKPPLQCDLSFEEFEVRVKQPCHYCGAEPTLTPLGTRGSIRANGLDRVDNSKGYTRDNVVPCCWPCNQWKHADTFDEFAKHALAISKKIYPDQFRSEYLKGELKYA